MENEILNQILSKLTSMETDIKDLKQGQAKLEQGQYKLEQGQAKLEQGQSRLEQDLSEVKERQLNDSKLLQAVFDQTIHLTEFKTKTDAKFDKLKSVL